MHGETYSTQAREAIIQWTERRSGHAARVTGRHPYATTPFEAEVGALRLAFPGYASEEAVEPISWDDFFNEFERDGLYFVYRETDDDGNMSYDYRIER